MNYILPSRADMLTEHTARQILVHNELVNRICDKPLPVKPKKEPEF